MGIVALLWLLEAIDLLIFRGRMDAFGVRPRTMTGLRGIVFAPFLHAGFGHLAANTIPFIVLGWLVMLRSTGDFFVVTAVSAAVSGLGVWLFGRAAFGPPRPQRRDLWLLGLSVGARDL